MLGVKYYSGLLSGGILATTHALEPMAADACTCSRVCLRKLRTHGCVRLGLIDLFFFAFSVLASAGAVPAPQSSNSRVCVFFFSDTVPHEVWARRGTGFCSRRLILPASLQVGQHLVYVGSLLRSIGLLIRMRDRWLGFLSQQSHKQLRFLPGLYVVCLETWELLPMGVLARLGCFLGFALLCLFGRLSATLGARGG